MVLALTGKTNSFINGVDSIIIVEINLLPTLLSIIDADTFIPYQICNFQIFDYRNCTENEKEFSLIYLETGALRSRLLEDVLSS